MGLMTQAVRHTIVIIAVCTLLGCSNAGELSAWLKNLISQPKPSQCDEMFWQQQKPILTTAALEKSTRFLCFEGFALLHSGVTRTPLWVAEHLTTSRIHSARRMHRQDYFHPEPRLPAAERSTLADYQEHRFDRGHMAPSGDMATPKQQQASFTLANMVPQSPRNNRDIWRNIEEATRGLTHHMQDIYVITGPTFLSERLEKIGQVLVPSHVFKVLYFPSRHIAAAYFAPNNESGQIEVISVAELERRIGINVLPRLSRTQKNKLIQLPLSAKEATRFRFKGNLD